MGELLFLETSTKYGKDYWVYCESLLSFTPQTAEELKCILNWNEREIKFQASAISYSQMLLENRQWIKTARSVEQAIVVWAG